MNLSKAKLFIKKKFNEKSLITIYGPTASGKTSLAIEIAKKFNGEIICADSRTVYKDMIIGTASPTKEEQQNIPHHLLHYIGPETNYSLADFQKDAYKHIKDILKRNKTPILVGGTNLFIDAVIKGFVFPQYKVTKEIENKLSKLSSIEKYNLLKEKDPISADQSTPDNERHFIRKLEYLLSTGKKHSDLPKQVKPSFFEEIAIKIELPREKMYTKINERVDIMIENGLIEEVKKLSSIYPKDHPGMTSIGYKEVISFLNEEYTKEEMIDKIKQHTRNYAKRQVTWLKH